MTVYNLLSATLIGLLFISCGKPSTHGDNVIIDSIEIAKIDAQYLYDFQCSSCHADSGVSQAPTMTLLAAMTPRSIYGALSNGKMRIQGEQLTEKEKIALANHLSRANTFFNGSRAPEFFNGEEPDKRLLNPCQLEFTAALDPTWSSWGGDPESTGYKTGLGISEANVSELKLKWAYGFPDAVRVRSQPAVIGDLLIIGSQNGSLYAINYQTGCTVWVTELKSSIRGAITVSNLEGQVLAFVADFGTNVYAIDVETGTIVWETKVGKHVQHAVSGSVAYSKGRLFVPLTSMEVLAAMNPNYDCCTSSGGVVALDAYNGKELWHFKTVPENPEIVGEKVNGGKIYAPSGGIVWSSPTIDSKRNVIYIGTGENYTRPTTNLSDAVLALDMETGSLLWSFQGTENDGWNLDCYDESDNKINCPDPPGPDLDFGMAPILTHTPDNRDLLIVGQKSGIVRALNPDNSGEILWENRIGKGTSNGGIHWGMATDGELAFAPVNDNRFWTPDPDSDHPLSPGVYAIEVTTGNIIWNQPAPKGICDGKPGCMESNSQAPTLIENVLFTGSLDGHIRAYRSSDGKLLWEYDTMRDFETVNGVKAMGGSLDGAGPVAIDGMLFVNSGYGLHGEAPGNVLLAFSVN